MLRTIGICTTYKDIGSLNHEKRSLVEQAKKIYDKVLLINTRHVSYQFIRGRLKPIILHNSEDISQLSSLHVRTTARRETSTALLAHSLELCGCDVFDPIDRFSVGYASKLLSTISRFQKKGGSNSFFAFRYENTLKLLEKMNAEKMFPIIVKPVKGKKGKGIEIFQDFDSARIYSADFFNSSYYTEDEPIFFQTYETFVEEFRVLVVDGLVLGTVKKIPAKGRITANAAQGAAFVKAENTRLIEFLEPYINSQGVVGIDVALNQNGEFRLLETNWAPTWMAFESATGINVAEYIINRSIERLNN